MDNIVPAVLATGAEIAKWQSDLGLSITSQLLDSLIKSLCAARGMWLWIKLETPDHKMSLSRNIASALIRRRSQQLFVSTSAFSEFCLDSARCGLAIPTVSCCSRPITQTFWSFSVCSVSINVG